MSGLGLSVQQKRQAIELGLAAYIMDANELQQAVAHWEAHYRDQPMYVLNRFIYDVCDAPHLRAQRHQILRSLIAEMGRLEKQGAQPALEHMQVEQFIPLRQALVLILEHMLAQVAQTDQFELTQLFAQQVQHRLGLKATIACEKLATQYWIHLLAAEQYCRTINLLYEIFCEFYGPIRADQVLAMARRLAKQEHPSLDLSQLL